MTENFDEEFDEHEPDISGTLIRSFFAVTTGIVIATFGYFTLIAIALLVVLPTKPDAEPAAPEPAEKVAEEVVKMEMIPPEEIPPVIFYLCPFAQALMALVGGYVAAKLAPASPFGHGALVAGFVLLTTMQMLLNKEAIMPTWVSGINAILGPACVMWGVSVFMKRNENSE